jgi:metal-sulfur cluster biosynthetic enzyme
MTANDDYLVAQIRQALKVVIDPELGYNIVDLGFVYDVSVDDGVAHITMTATTRGCPAASFLKEGVANSAGLVPGVEAVDVTMTFEPPWQPWMISPGVKAARGFAEVN